MTIRYPLVATFLLCIAGLPTAAQDIVVKELTCPMVIHEGDLHDFPYTRKATANRSKVRLFEEEEEEETVVNYKDRITNMPEFFHDFVVQYAEATREVLDGGTNWLANPSLGQYDFGEGVYYYLLDEMTGTINMTFPGNTADTNQQAALNAIQVYIDEAVGILDSFLPYAYLSCNFDHPEAFWIGNRYQYGCIPSCNYQWDSNREGTVTYSIKLLIILHDRYFDIRNKGNTGYNFRSSTSDLNKCIPLFNSSIRSIVDQCQSGTRYNTLLKVHDWLTTHNGYNTMFASNPANTSETLGGMPWSPLSAIEGNVNNRQAPVCEGYARALKVLCDTLGIPCILMPGEACKTISSVPEKHMWNYVQMEDGNWYAIDPTWDDPYIKGNNKAISGHESRQWFLLGSTTAGDDEWTFENSHPEQWTDVYENKGPYGWDFISGPVLSPTAYNPYDSNKDGVADMEDVHMMAEKIVNGEDDIEDLDENDRITVGDLVRLINNNMSELSE